MNLNNEDIKHIAHLARIEINEKEIEKFGEQLSDILEYFKELQKADLNNLRLVDGDGELQNPLRLDEVIDCDIQVQNDILENFPDKSGRYAKVNKVL